MSARAIWASALAMLVLGACAPKQEGARPTSVACAPEGQPGANDSCDMQLDGRTLHVRFGALPEGDKGTIDIEALSASGAVTQVMSEKGVGAYFYPSAVDIDGDKRTDLLIMRMVGNVNAEQGVWRQKADGTFARVGEISGGEPQRTVDGLLAVPARSSAAEWSVAFYRVGDNLTPIATINVEGEGDDSGKVKKITCKLSDSPGIASLNLSAKAAEKKFCAEPAANVFDK